MLSEFLASNKTLGAIGTLVLVLLVVGFLVVQQVLLRRKTLITDFTNEIFVSMTVENVPLHFSVQFESFIADFADEISSVIMNSSLMDSQRCFVTEL